MRLMKNLLNLSGVSCDEAHPFIELHLPLDFRVGSGHQHLAALEQVIDLEWGVAAVVGVWHSQSELLNDRI